MDRYRIHAKADGAYLEKHPDGDCVLYADATDPLKVAEEMRAYGFVVVTKEQWADHRAVEEELACLRDKLSEMIIVGGQALACSPDVKAAYQRVEEERGRLRAENQELHDVCQREMKSVFDAAQEQIATLTAEVAGLKNAGEPIFQVRKGNQRFAAYPRKITAEVYASGFSDKVEIVEGRFVPLAHQEGVTT